MTRGALLLSLLVIIASCQYAGWNSDRKQKEDAVVMLQNAAKFLEGVPVPASKVVMTNVFLEDETNFTRGVAKLALYQAMKHTSGLLLNLENPEVEKVVDIGDHLSKTG
ncbi:hypothetical protein PMAYCL1PPCAC_13628, partial [Pristionchus mayeri]